LLGILVLFLAIGSIDSGSRAYFSDIETAVSNTITLASEPISIVKVGGDGMWNSPTWLVSMYANERKATTITFANSWSEDITISLNVSPPSHDEGNLTFGFDNQLLVVPGKGEASVVFWVQTSQSVTPGNYSSITSIEHEASWGRAQSD
jgi:hypothetical protein